MREFKEDSTKGNAKVLPVNYKGDVLAQAWLDARKIAVLSKWLESKGYTPRFLSEVVRLVVDAVVETVTKNGEVENVEFTEDARDYLLRRYRAVFNPSGRGKRNMIHNLHLDERRKMEIYGSRKGSINQRNEEEVEARRKAEEGAKLFEKMKAEGRFSSREVEGGEEEDRKERVYDSIRKNFVQDENGVLVPRSSVKVDAIKHKSESEVARDIERRLEEDRQLAEMDMDAPDTGVVEIDD